VSQPFGTSLRRDPTDSRGLRERIDALILERLEEAIDSACLDLLVRVRQEHGLPPPVADSTADREEFEALVLAFLGRLEAVLATGAEATDADRSSQAAPTSSTRTADMGRLVAAQVRSAKLLPDYWQRFEAVKEAFTAEQRQASPARAGLFARLFGRPE